MFIWKDVVEPRYRVAGVLPGNLVVALLEGTYLEEVLLGSHVVGSIVLKPWLSPLCQLFWFLSFVPLQHVWNLHRRHEPALSPLFSDPWLAFFAACTNPFVLGVQLQEEEDSLEGMGNREVGNQGNQGVDRLESQEEGLQGIQVVVRQDNQGVARQDNQEVVRLDNPEEEGLQGNQQEVDLQGNQEGVDLRGNQEVDDQKGVRVGVSSW